jgi:hypothetical protein
MFSVSAGTGDSMAHFVAELRKPIHPAGKDQTHLIPAMLRKLSCHVLVTHLVEMSPA